MKRKTLSVLVIFMTAILIGTMVSAAGLIFTDDFSSGDFSKWTNAVIENGNDADLEVVGVVTISNNTLHIKNYDPVGSFFYLAPKGIKTKNFTVSMKVKANSLRDGWIGFSIRKETNDRYNGTNNIMIYFRHNTEGSWVSATRGYFGSVIDINGSFTEQTTFTGDLTVYNTYKVVAKDGTFTAYINDVKVGVLVYDRAATNNPGYVSINASMADVSIQNFRLETEDGTSDITPEPTVTSGAGPTPTSAPSATPTNKPTESNSASSSSAGSSSESQSDSVQTSSDSESETTSEDLTSNDASQDPTDSNSPDESQTASELQTSDNSRVETSSPDNDEASGKFPTVPVIVVSILLLGGAGTFVYFKFYKK